MIHKFPSVSICDKLEPCPIRQKVLELYADLDKKKADVLTAEEEAEYARILELERIFTLINAQLAAKSKWCPTQLEDLYDEPDTSLLVS